MPQWSETDPAYISYLRTFATQAMLEVAKHNTIPTTILICQWHRDVYRPVALHPCAAGCIRGTRKGNCPVLARNVGVGQHICVTAAQVPARMRQFDTVVMNRTVALDEAIRSQTVPDDELLNQMVSLVAWAHGELIRIHPFVDSNGRMSRLVANCILDRYSSPFLLTVRPRPPGSYRQAADASMSGDDSAMEAFIHWGIVQETGNPTP